MHSEIAQRDYQMFERNIVHLARRAREVRVGVGRGSVENLADGTSGAAWRSYVGFLAGLDEGYIQICRTDNQCLVLIDRDEITEVEATGNTIWSYEKEGLTASLKRIKDACWH